MTTESPAATQLQLLDGLYRELGLDPNDLPGLVEIIGADPVTPSVHRIGDACAVALAAMGTEVAALWRDRSGRGQDVRVEVEEAVCQLMAALLTTVAGVPTFGTGEQNLLTISDFYRTADGRVIDISMPYPHLRDIVCDVLDCAPSHDRISGEVAKWDAIALEDALNARGGAATVVRTADEWREHKAGKALEGLPLIRIEKIGNSAPEPFPELPEGNPLPLAGLRVLDNGHVLAGPLAARMLAEHGAEVLHISHPAWPEPLATHCEANLGKRAAYCDLNDPVQAGTFRELLRQADVYVSSWRSLQQKGFGAKDLASTRPGIVVLEFSAFGDDGPWSGRGGFDYQAGSATGVYADEGTAEEPKRPPTMLLNDYLAPILANAATIEALRRRARDGGSYRVHITLAQVSMWAKSLGTLPREHIADIPMVNPMARPDMFDTVPGPYGPTTYLTTRVRYSETTPTLRRGAEPLGASPLAWTTE